MSNDDRPEFQALEELRVVLTALTGELATWRRRALKAEAQQAELGVEHDVVATRERILELESQNAEVHTRLEEARKRVTDLLGRLRFLEEQVALEEQRR
ncbi:MAG: hypothetical protein GTN62_11065 [Gemmatimonadales bacterium]|nr:hypothetical protein [Gemmatimonadales bacterium]NIN12221.1 hypothetical protein [Gemmatimonadales bacterium]NIN50636.1 hypothetical protein [Gemmatimonadales bacterium]NIP08100.1 hypothetical protein [Gemmatimonadales bacterium]NIR03390.1 hypothetical protein [Gemmatimonadales bacterium]